MNVGEEQQAVSSEASPHDPESLHLQNVHNLLHTEAHQSLLRHHQHQQATAKHFADQLARRAPKTALQVLQPPQPGDKNALTKRILRRQQILDGGKGENTALSAAGQQQGVEPILARVPIKLDLEMEGYKLRDSLLWSLLDSSISPEDFALITCDDFELPHGIFAPAIVKALTEQIGEYQEFLGMLRMMGGLKEFSGIRGLIRLDITIEGLSLVDKFEWDLGETRNCPEDFATSYARDLALPPQFIPAVTNDIYEQVYLLRRSLLQTGFARDPVTGQLTRITDPDLAELVAVFSASSLVPRDPTRLDEFTPLVTILESGELERMELSRDREARRKRRQAKAKKSEGLSVRSPPKTMLTPLEYRGSTHRQLKLADDGDGEPAVPLGRRGRRRA